MPNEVRQRGWLKSSTTCHPRKQQPIDALIRRLRRHFLPKGEGYQQTPRNHRLMLYLNIYLTVKDAANVEKVRGLLAEQGRLSREEPGCSRFEVYHSQTD